MTVRDTACSCNCTFTTGIDGVLAVQNRIRMADWVVDRTILVKGKKNCTFNTTIYNIVSFRLVPIMRYENSLFSFDILAPFTLLVLFELPSRTHVILGTCSIVTPSGYDNETEPLAM